MERCLDCGAMVERDSESACVARRKTVMVIFWPEGGKMPLFEGENIRLTPESLVFDTVSDE